MAGTICVSFWQEVKIAAVINRAAHSDEIGSKIFMIERLKRENRMVEKQSCCATTVERCLEDQGPILIPSYTFFNPQINPWAEKSNSGITTWVLEHKMHN
jgi:hypothetical protein